VKSAQNVNSSNDVTGGVDYDSGPYTVTFSSGQTRAPFVVPINDDNILEGDENFTVAIVGNALPDVVTRGSPASTTVIIVDDDGKLL